jgi:hypothetical protein
MIVCLVKFLGFIFDFLIFLLSILPSFYVEEKEEEVRKLVEKFELLGAKNLAFWKSCIDRNASTEFVDHYFPFRQISVDEVKKLSENFIVELFLREKGIDKLELEKDLESGKVKFLETILRLFSPFSEKREKNQWKEEKELREQKEQKEAEIIYNTFKIGYFDENPQTSYNETTDVFDEEKKEKYLEFYVIQYLRKKVPEILSLLDERQLDGNLHQDIFIDRKFDHLLFKEANDLNKIDEKLIDCFKTSVDSDEEESFSNYLFRTFLRDPKLILERNSYIWKIIVLEKFISPREFVMDGKHFGRNELSFSQLIHPHNRGRDEKKLVEIIHNLVALGGQEIIDSLRFLIYIKEKNLRKFQNLFEYDLLFYKGLKEEILGSIIAATLLPKDIVKIVKTF